MIEDLYPVYSVSEVTTHIKDLLESDPILTNVYVQGEISSLTKARSGHVYFTIQDENSQLSCVMFKASGFSSSQFNFNQGDLVTVRGSFSVYLPYGRYQFYVREVQMAGVGNLYKQFLALKEKLNSEGLFDETHKKELPLFPNKIGVVTSPSGAVIHDMIRTYQRKYPAFELVLVPALVQGETAAKDIIEGIKYLDKREDIDLIIIARGGGSFEDLWCFNDEKLVRAVFDLQKPVVSAVGHETDFSLTDFVADHRAPTPTAAAELTVPDKNELLVFLEHCRSLIGKACLQDMNELGIFLDDHRYQIEKECLNKLSRNYEMIGFLKKLLSSKSIKDKLSKYHESMAHLLKDKIKSEANSLSMVQLSMFSYQKSKLAKVGQDMQHRIEHLLISKRHQLENFLHELDKRDITSNLKRGYTLTRQEGKIVKSVDQLSSNKEVETLFHDGKLTSKVLKLRKTK